MSADDMVRPLSSPPPGRAIQGGALLQHDRFDDFSSMQLWTLSGGAIDISNAADGSDTVSDLEVDTHPGEDLLGGDTVTWATSDANFALLIAAKINEKTAEHQYWATASADHVLIWPKNPWIQDTGTITVTDTSFTASIEDMDAEQAFATGARILSNAASNIAGTSMYALGFDHSWAPQDSGANMGFVQGADTRPTLDGRKPSRLNFRTATARRLLFSADQITTWYDIGGGNYSLAASTERGRNVYQWREWPIFMQAAAAATAEYEVLSY